ncbi:MAG: hypothetical protein ACRCX2_12420 [Paraclostridium sp.]
MQFKMFKEDHIESLEVAVRKWTRGFTTETDFEVQYKPVATSYGRVFYTAFVRVK